MTVDRQSFSEPDGLPSRGEDSMFGGSNEFAAEAFAPKLRMKARDVTVGAGVAFSVLTRFSFFGVAQWLRANPVEDRG